MQHKTPARLHRSARQNRNGIFYPISLNFQLVKEFREINLASNPVHNQAHGAVSRMGAHVNYGPLEPRVSHGRHGNQKLPGQITTVTVTVVLLFAADFVIRHRFHLIS